MARIGGTKCQVCGNADATVSKTATGTLSISCHRCEASAFAKVGTRAHRLVLASMIMDDDQKPEQKTSEPSEPNHKEKPQKSQPQTMHKPASVFSLGDL